MVRQAVAIESYRRCGVSRCGGLVLPPLQVPSSPVARLSSALRRRSPARLGANTAPAILDKDNGKHFYPDVVRAFLGVLPEILKSYPALKAA